ncbi:MAG: nucleotide exchange factor GrpE [Hyphomicrobiales bacterium]|nr:nucleotide exchange factor GrpE [Hyphomicrobiales bacterium]
MTGNTEHQEDNSDLEQDDSVKIDQPLGGDKQSLKDAADAILQAGGATAEAYEANAEFESDETADPLVVLVNDLKVAHAEKNELQNQLLRTVAEMENLRKRTRKEIADAREFSIASFARDLLGVSDNLRRAIDAVPAEEAAADTSGLRNLMEGVSLTERELLSALEKHKVRKMSPKGERFDPNFHQAMFEVPDKEMTNNTVVEVVQEGYVIGQRMLRPAMVGVSKGGPKAPRNESIDENGN